MSDELDLNIQTPPTEAPQEPLPTPEPSPAHQTAQLPPTEPLATEPEPIEELEPKPASNTEAVSASVSPEKPQSRIKELLNNARFAIQTRKKKKLEKIMTLFAKRTSITNDEVEKLLHVSDATATRYLSILEKENKIKQSGKTGKGVSYSKY